MSFSYDLTTDIGVVRLELGDTTPDAGVKPDGTNLSNEELQVWLDREGGVMLAVAAACEALARQWSAVTTISVGPKSETLSLISKAWADRASELRGLYGYGDEDAGANAGGFSVETKREDEYS